jgi:hypothetical protein
MNALVNSIDTVNLPTIKQEIPEFVKFVEMPVAGNMMPVSVQHRRNILKDFRQRGDSDQ